jgi:mannose-1-phosphate guanylyltransferase
MKKIHVLLSGGSGSRLWPLSRKSRTKQYIPIFDGLSLFEKAIRLNQHVCNEGLVVVNSASYKNTAEIIDACKISNYECIIETKPKNTAAAIAFAALKANYDDLLLVTPSDHVIENIESYKNAVNQAFEFASQGYLVTFGIKPSRPETGYGYIQSNGNDVVAFHEKPSLEKANQYVASVNFYWNSGIFAFKAGVYLEELMKFRNDIFTACLKVHESSNSAYLDEHLSELIPSESIDYAVMEKSDKIKVIPGFFEWSDLGSFESLYDYFRSKSAYVSGSNLVIANDHVELHGLENVMVIQNHGALLIMPLSMSQEVKKIYERLDREGRGLVE